MNEAFAGADLPNALRLLREKISGRIVFTTSLGIEDQALTHAIAVAESSTSNWRRSTPAGCSPKPMRCGMRQKKNTGCASTPFIRKPTRRRRWLRDQGINGFYDSLEARKACCNVRKVEPLSRALKNAQGWVAGLRGDQSDHRSHLRYVEYDAARGLIKASPLLDFSRDDVAHYCASA